MEDFGFYLREGFYHITDWKGYDHILFIMALCLPYFAKDWKKILVLVTAFTIGHSVTLALSVFDAILISSKWIEFLIPVTILLTSLGNILQKKETVHQPKLRYIAALLFGCIHGLGFSNYLKSMLGKSETIVTQLLAFNLGLEIGQLLIVAAVLLVAFVFIQVFNVLRREWMLFVTGGIAALSLVMALDRIPF
ncbi:HupE/UreJ family protein [Lacibacter luteus]|uniref:HupE/UreJ family protein n=1 Tax=Lacibacter luteus TaxID=2508719 RepID=A0A4Q1CDI7_9BACT|nr:HupE/UreJ family protein [Lacibacter luteus]RXK57705.1 HupE/UreJ family protein [Lacibacter luteus]